MRQTPGRFALRGVAGAGAILPGVGWKPRRRTPTGRHKKGVGGGERRARRERECAARQARPGGWAEAHARRPWTALRQARAGIRPEGRPRDSARDAREPDCAQSSGPEATRRPSVGRRRLAAQGAWPSPVDVPWRASRPSPFARKRPEHNTSCPEPGCTEAHRQTQTNRTRAAAVPASSSMSPESLSRTTA